TSLALPPQPAAGAVSNMDDLLRLEPEIESGRCLKLHASSHTVALPPHNHVGRKKAFDGEVPLKLRRIPHLAVLAFEIFSTARIGIDLDEFLAANVFGRVGHGCSPVGTDVYPRRYNSTDRVRRAPGRRQGAC